MSYYDFKGSPIVVPLTIFNVTKGYFSETLNLKTIATRLPGQKFKFRFRVAPGNNSAYFVSSMIDQYSSFDFKVPQLYIPGQTLGSPNVGSVTSTASAGAATVTFTAANPIQLGRFIRFNNHHKLYVVTVSRSSGTQVTSIFPNLVASVPAGTLVYYQDDVVGKFEYDTSLLSGIIYVDGVLSDPGDITVVEKL
jgi:hypothetical protein